MVPAVRTAFPILQMEKWYVFDMLIYTTGYLASGVYYIAVECIKFLYV